MLIFVGPVAADTQPVFLAGVAVGRLRSVSLSRSTGRLGPDAQLGARP